MPAGYGLRCGPHWAGTGCPPLCSQQLRKATGAGAPCACLGLRSFEPLRQRAISFQKASRQERSHLHGPRALCNKTNILFGGLKPCRASLVGVNFALAPLSPSCLLCFEPETKPRGKIVKFLVPVSQSASNFTCIPIPLAGCTSPCRRDLLQ